MALIATLIGKPQASGLPKDLVERAADSFCGPAVWLQDNLACELKVPDTISGAQAEAMLFEHTRDHTIDFAIQLATGRRKKVLIADMDSTMIEQECIDELAAEAGVKDKVAEITARAMNGEIEFEAALNERVSLLTGLSESIIETVIENRIQLAAGGRQLVKTMRKHNGYTALVSGGFTAFTKHVAKQLGFHHHRANQLEISKGKLTGRVIPPILGAEAKLNALHELAAQHKLTPADFIAVGDGANDLPMLLAAGTGVALHAKPIVAEQARIRINHADLTALLFLQGYRRSEFAD